MENNKKKEIAKITVFITSLFVIFLSVSYAFLTSVLTGSKSVVINAGVLDLVLEEENAITLSNAYPMYDEVGMIQEESFNFKLVNKTTNDTNYILKLIKVNENNELATNIVKYYLSKDGIGKIDFLSNIGSDNIVDSGKIKGSNTINYSLRLWIDSNVTENSKVSGKKLSYKVSVEVSQEIPKEKVTILGKTFEVSLDSIDFSQISSETNGRGIYKYTEEGVDIYYWRGKVLDNHVIFGGYCWEMVRTTKTGGIKMIYDGTPVDGKCTNTGTNSQIGTSEFNTNYNDNAYVGYMYGATGATTYEETHQNTNNSQVKTKIDTWFSTSSLNTEENLAKIEDAVYCNDRSMSSGTGIGASATDYAAYNRLVTNKTPSLECTNVNDRFTVSSDNGNGALTYPVSLITTDEVALAGGVYSPSNNDYYLYTGQFFWHLSPCGFSGNNAFGFLMFSSGLMSSISVSFSFGVRPVVSLAAGSEFTGSGDGTENNPYIVN